MLARLLALHPKRIDLSLDRIERILAALDHPERRLPPVIHVAGTNGKGSTIAFMRAILEAAGKRVHVYTSPNLVRINERFRIGREGGGKLVGDAELDDALAECEAKNGDAPITVFEMETAAGFVLFSRHPADVASARSRPRRPARRDQCRRTPAGERHHAAVARPPRFSRRHARSKSPPRRPAFSSRMCRRWSSARRARRSPSSSGRRRGCAAPLSIAGEDWTATEERGRLVYQDDDGLLDLPAPKLYGRHQFENAGAAIAALRVSGLKLPAAAFEAGMTRVDWPARMQRLAARPACRICAAGQRTLARRRPQCRRRPGHCSGACRSRRARAAAARAHRRHAVDQGQRRFSEEFFRPGASRHRGADPSGQGGAGGSARRSRRDVGIPAIAARRSRKRDRRSPASSISSRRRASSSPARFISPARFWPPTARRRSDMKQKVRSFQFDIRRANDIGPFRLFALDEVGEIIWRSGHQFEHLRHRGTACGSPDR